MASPFIRDADPADKGDLAVNDEQLTMAAIVEAANVPPENGMVFLDVHARVLQPRQILRSHLAGALRVQNRVHFHASLRAFRQRFRELPRDIAVPEDIGLEIDGALRAMNTLQHRREDLIAICESDDAVAGDEIWTQERSRGLPKFRRSRRVEWGDFCADVFSPLQRAAAQTPQENESANCF